LAIKAHRDYYRDKYHIYHPELICCESAHAAVDKACDLLHIRLIKVPMESGSYELDVQALTGAVTANTILLYASAPSFPHGAIDPIEHMAAIAHTHDIGLHVDCCLGGFVLPFARQLGHDIPAFDFSVKGVTSMSIDTHKYGFALKGSSVLLYSNPDIRQAQYFCYPEWTGGLYTTPTVPTAC
jgi:glutamate/tyrosine decarboxylase-like PLP-dependent enzyme